MVRNEALDKKIIQGLCAEFESLWLVDAKDSHMTAYYVNSEKAIPGMKEMASRLTSYEFARLWYTDNYVKEEEREYARFATSVPHIIEELKENGYYYVDFIREINSADNYNQLYYSKINDEDEITGFVLGFRDVDSRKTAEVDELTGLFNKSAFFRYVLSLMNTYPDVTFDVVISDIIDFKKINEKYGMAVGDRILKAAGGFLRGKSNETNVIGRYDGDQFAVVLPHRDMELVLKEIEQHEISELGDNLPTVTIKYGVFCSIDPLKPISVQCDNARIALNSIKHQYGQRIAVFDDKIKSMLEHSRTIEDNMHKALSGNQFKVYYQPKHDAITGKLIGAEALVRWIHPEKGFMSPGEFIPVFERNGFINEVDCFVWQRTCENIRRWLDKGIDVVPVSVNKSKLAFNMQDLLSKIEKPVHKYNIPKELLHIEITESLMEDNLEHLIEVMNEIKSAGYKFELDDFGAGYSSINILSTLPLDVVKLDMSFIKQFGITKRIKVLAACINLAKNLGYETISEGVETIEQLNALKTLGVDAIQGYYFSKPLPEDEFEQYMLRETQE